MCMARNIANPKSRRRHFWLEIFCFVFLFSLFPRLCVSLLTEAVLFMYLFAISFFDHFLSPNLISLPWTRMPFVNKINFISIWRPLFDLCRVEKANLTVLWRVIWDLWEYAHFKWVCFQSLFKMECVVDEFIEYQKIWILILHRLFPLCLWMYWFYCVRAGIVHHFGFVFWRQTICIRPFVYDHTVWDTLSLSHWNLWIAGHLNIEDLRILNRIIRWLIDTLSITVHTSLFQCYHLSVTSPPFFDICSLLFISI